MIDRFKFIHLIIVFQFFPEESEPGGVFGGGGGGGRTVVEVEDLRLSLLI